MKATQAQATGTKHQAPGTVPVSVSVAVSAAVASLKSPHSQSGKKSRRECAS